jgi:hypothetical protein
MKNKERNQRLQEAESNLDRLALARDEIPGSQFDDLIADAMLFSRSPDEAGFDYWKSLSEKQFLSFGHLLARGIVEGNSGFFRSLADAIDLWREHKPNPDKRLEALFEIVRLQSSNEMLAQGPLPKLSMRAVIAYMRGKGLVSRNPDLEEYNNLAHTIRGWSKKYKLKISGPAGRPKSGRERKKSD